MRKIIVAIDGLSSCGKSTMAKDLAREIGYTYIDTGAMYRAVTLYALRNGLFDGERPDVHRLEEALGDVSISFTIHPETGETETLLNGENVEHEIRNMEVASHVSVISALSFVRNALVRLQHRMGAQKGVVMDGRDIGTVVFPEAELKIFLTATPDARAQRRFDELSAKGIPASYKAILENIKSRDYQDMTRAISPLCQADDAIVLDNTNLTIAEQKAWLLERFNRLITA